MFYSGLSFENKIEKAALDGFEYFEFWRWSGRNFNSLASTMKDRDIKLSAFSGDDEFSMINADEKISYLEFLKNSINKAASIGCPNLVIHSDALDPGTGKAKRIEKKISFETRLLTMYEVLKSAALMGEKAGVNLVLEPLNIFVDHENYFLSDPNLAFDILRQLGSDRVKVLFDIYHMQIMGGNIIQTLEKNLDIIAYIHAADVPGRNEPGTGELNYRNIFQALNSSGYDGFVGFELSPFSNDQSAVDAIMRSMV
jgi:hydroxypyruvate isomerase